MSRPIFNSITSEGGLLPADFLQSLLAPKPVVDGLKPADYHLDPNDRLNDVVAGSWNKLRSRWQTFRSKIEGRLSGDSTTSETRELWLQPLLGELGFGRVPVVRGLSFGDRAFDISHQWDSIPLHLVGTHVDLDQRTPGATGASRGSPHSIVQQLLNADPQRLWGVVSNGWQLRLLRDNAALTRQAYIEFDLQSIFDGDLYPEFVVLWLVLHQSRFEAREGQHSRCWLEMWRQAADQKGLRALEHLRYGVESAITSLGAGLLSNPHNGPLREALSSGQLTTQALYQQILRTVYRMIFLFVAEDRGLLHPRDASDEAIRAKARYSAHYSLSRLRELQLSRAGTPHPDLWIVFQLVTRKLGEEGAPELSLPILGSFLWSAGATKELNGCLISNRHFLEAVHALAFTQEEAGLKRTVDYRNLGAEELGSVYEGLLEQHVSVDPAAQIFTLDTAAGNERKTSGSYYTPDSLVQCLLDSALEPVVAEAARGKTGEVAAKALLALKICDPAVGSGHFLIAAAHRLAKRVAAAKTGEEEPSPEATRTALRDVIGHCLYGVDINPMSAELCRVSLWLEALEPGKPLSFLDHHIRCGNSLLGVTPELIKGGIPDGAYEALEGDDKEAGPLLKSKNKRENPKLGQWFIDDEAALREKLFKASAEIEEIGDSRAEDIRRKEAAFHASQSNFDFGRARDLADLWCAAFVIKKRFPASVASDFESNNLPTAIPALNAETQVVMFGGDESAPDAKAEKTKAPSRAGTEPPIGITTQNLRDFVDGSELPDGLLAESRRLAARHQFFHFHIAFPEVFTQGGFDVILGNPPWERTALEELEFFARSCPEVITAGTTAIRKQVIQSLRVRMPQLFEAYAEEKRKADVEGHFFNTSGLYPLGAKGRLNTYALFANLGIQLIRPTGRLGMVLQSGLATDAPMEEFWRFLVEERRLVAFIDFENKKRIFQDVHPEQKFALVSIAGSSRNGEEPTIVGFWLQAVSELSDADKVYKLEFDDLERFSPNTRQPLLTRRRSDVEVLRRIYSSSEICWSATLQHGPAKAWVAITSASFSQFCRREADLPGAIRKKQWELESDGVLYSPLLEAKQMEQYDCCFATYEGTSAKELAAGSPQEIKHIDGNLYDIPKPRFWADKLLVAKFFDAKSGDRGWRLGYRDVTNVNNERTAIATVLPRVGFLQPLNGISCSNARTAAMVLGAINSVICDFVARLRFTGRHLNVTTFAQLPIPRRIESSFVVPRVVELVYVGECMKEFAVECGCDSAPYAWNASRRFQLRCELDAAFGHYYGLSANDMDYVLQTFNVLRSREEREFGEFRTRDAILECFETLG